MIDQTKKYQTQWAAQFYAAAELTRRGYLVSLTLGNAPVADLLVISPDGRNFMVDVKGQATGNFWIIKRRPPQDNLFYILVYLPRDGGYLKFFILSYSELMKEREEYRKRIKSKGGKYRDSLGGINWSTALKYEDRWDKLPR